MLCLHHTLLLQSPEHHSWPSGKFDSCIELELLNLAVVVAAADAIPTLCPPTTVARTNSWPSAAAFFPRVGRAIDWLVLMRVMLYFPSRCLAPGLSRCLRRKFLATPSALVPRLSCYRCWTYSHHCQIPDRNRRKDHGTENFGGFVYVLDRFPQRELGLWVFMCTIIMASLPCTGPDLLSIGQSNRYICLASQCTQRMATHFCLALANQEAHFCLALLSIAPHFAYCIAPQRSALQRSYTHTHGFCTP